MDTAKVTRFEVIDHSGETSYHYASGARALVRLGVSVELALQDGGRTLKVILTPGRVPAGEVASDMSAGLSRQFREQYAEQWALFPMAGDGQFTVDGDDG